MSRRFASVTALTAVILTLPASLALAASMNYGDFMGTSVTYRNVTESNSEPNLLFSAPSVVGDTLEFDPVNFFAEVDPGPGSDITDSEINTIVEAKPGFFIDNIQISEEGDFSLDGVPGAFGHAGVGAAFFFEVLGVNGVLVGDGRHRPRHSGGARPDEGGLTGGSRGGEERDQSGSERERAGPKAVSQPRRILASAPVETRSSRGACVEIAGSELAIDHRKPAC